MQNPRIKQSVNDALAAAIKATLRLFTQDVIKKERATY
jgi:hypothetical protein